MPCQPPPAYHGPVRRVGLLLPALTLVVAATDPIGDLVPCGRPRPGGSREIDIVSASGYLIEGGTALAFTVTFAGDPTVPDGAGHPFRVDVLINDPRVPALSFGPYRKVNRIIRFEATSPPAGTVFLLPEGGRNEPSTFVYGDRTVRLTVAGRLLTLDEDLQGLDLRPLRWGVIVRDEDVCDRLGSGRPTLPLEETVAASPPSPPVADEPLTGTGFPWVPTAAAAVALAGALALGVAWARGVASRR